MEDSEDADEQLIEQMCNLWIVNDRVTINDNNEDLENLKWEICLLGKFLTDKYINFVGLNDYLQMKWSPKHMEIKKTEYDVYIFQFHHEMDIQQVLDG